ncbi:Nucleotide-binding universal stress protein, UspA family [Halomicrobium zhouii]|uniref:Nucleotide-binding universal stress protein, UspA family n=1 Tax=Halomicrobium zhouii TaxID=767519 RepID=A0A1I6M6V8_9EURY|nr:universal stress protein [Halomicrobium zhouii]SFS11434.1 Nucleotide-binding universal stress protein, UspA family [Halomicrobium zhouii]
MERALVVLETGEDGQTILREASELAAGVDAHLDVLALMTPEEYEEKRESLEAAGKGEHTTYNERAVLDNLRQRSEGTVEETLDGLDLDWDVVAARLGDSETEADRILQSAEKNDTDHVFLTGKKRSPTGKAVFGDRAQAIILNFDGPVTTLLG